MPALTLTQKLCQTALTKTGSRNMLNRKHFRNTVQRAEAKGDHFKTEGGSYRSYVPRQMG